MERAQTFADFAQNATRGSGPLPVLVPKLHYGFWLVHGLTETRNQCYWLGVTIALQLPSDLQEFVEEAVKSGRFSDEEELVCEALESLRTREEFRQFQLAKLKDKLQAGVADLDAGRVAEWNGEDIKRQGRALLAARLAGA